VLNEYMCPNCLTPWPCNGPHISEEIVTEEFECPCCKDWFTPCDDVTHTNELHMCAFCATGQHDMEAPCTPE